MTSITESTSPDPMEAELEQILDKHAEYYIRETMKFFQKEGESPALSLKNPGDLKAKAALVTLLLKQWRAVLENYQKETDSTNYIIMRDRLEERIAQIDAQIKGQK